MVPNSHMQIWSSKRMAIIEGHAAANKGKISTVLLTAIPCRHSLQALAHVGARAPQRLVEFAEAPAHLLLEHPLRRCGTASMYSPAELALSAPQ